MREYTETYSGVFQTVMVNKNSFFLIRLLQSSHSTTIWWRQKWKRHITINRCFGWVQLTRPSQNTMSQRCYNVILMFWRRYNDHTTSLTSCVGCDIVTFPVLSIKKCTQGLVYSLTFPIFFFQSKRRRSTCFFFIRT